MRLNDNFGPAAAVGGGDGAWAITSGFQDGFQLQRDLTLYKINKSLKIDALREVGEDDGMLRQTTDLS